jgi:hypothetical protein
MFLALAAATPAAAADKAKVSLEPAAPRQGDTISVFVPAQAAGGARPVVVIGEHRYPAFDLGDGRARAFVPTCHGFAP